MAQPMKFRKKSITIEARQLVGDAPATMAVAHWVEENGYPWLVGNALDPNSLRAEGQDPKDSDRPTKGIYIAPADGALVIRTLEGDMRATYGDWIIRGVAGEFYPCRADIFAATYEKASAG